MNNNISNEEDKKEYFDTETELAEKIAKLVEAVKNAKHCVFFTGAGISTSAGIPDFRSSKDTVLETGPGKWEKAALGMNDFVPKKSVQMLNAFPTKAHMSLVKLLNEGLAKFLISQNTDGLHRKSGVRPEQMAELHGNVNMEKCAKCGKKYMRDFRTRTAVAAKEHGTGRKCDDSNCEGDLLDSIINFEENLPKDELDKAWENANKADVIVCLGSSLRVHPACDMPKRVAENKGKLVIVNLQKTPLFNKAFLNIHAKIDTVLEALMAGLGVEIPKWRFTRRILLEFVEKNTLLVKGVDLDGKEYSIFKKVQLFVGNRCFTKCKNPLLFHFFEDEDKEFELRLTFQGFYNEPEAVLKLERTNLLSPKISSIEYDPFEEKWGEPVYFEALKVAEENNIDKKNCVIF